MRRRGDPNQAELLSVYDVAPDPVIGLVSARYAHLEHVRRRRSTFQAQDFAALGAELAAHRGAGHRNDFAGAARSVHRQRLRRGGGLEYGDVAAATVDDASDVQIRDPQRTWSTYQRPLLRWLMYRKVEQPPTVQSVTLWAARQKRVEDGTDNRYL